jgi:signal transduction histidine kinase/CheY-like chemotaxis protein
MGNLEVGPEMLGRMLDALDFPVYTFDKNRRVIYTNKATQKYLPPLVPGKPMGAAEAGHFENNQYFDVDGNPLDYPNNSAVDRALRGEATDDLVLEHRDVKNRTNRWVSISCTPVFENDEFKYGILWYRDVSRKQSREHKLRFLLSATKVLSITTDFKKRLQEKAALAVPTLADWCSIEILAPDGSIERVALIHRDPKKIAWIEEYERKYPTESGARAAERVIATGKPEFTPRITKEMIDNAPGLSEEQREDIRTLELASIMILPIGSPGNVLGTLSLAYAESGRSYTEEDFAFFEEFARHLGVIVENAQLYTEINQRDLYKDMFLASFSHELRNPLAPIKSSLELLKLKHVDPEVLTELSVIEHQFDHMERLLNDLLDATRFVRGKIHIESSPTQLNDIVEHVVRAVDPVAKSSDVELTVTPPSFPITVEADRTRLEQALMNVLNNAVKFTPRGGKVDVSYSEDGDVALISVKDTGVGITPEEFAHIFEPYYQSERVRAGNSGLGIGLRLVQEIVRLHGGSIEVESEGTNLGSEFLLRIPLAKEEEVRYTKAMTEPDPVTTTKRILIIDDNQAAADALVRLFNALGYSAIAHYSAKDAFVHMDETPVDIIFADIGMPEMNGYEFVKTLRENGYTDMPVVALTGYGLEEDRARAMDAGFNEHLTKPVGAEDLRRTISSLT